MSFTYLLNSLGMLGAEKGNGDQFRLHLVWGSPMLWDCISQTRLGEVWGRIERVELLKPKLMFIKGRHFLKTFYEIAYLE